ncbi:MAG: hypothetical protein AB2L14_28885 [Candidatus Xenobiia bacterium LiM19]
MNTSISSVIHYSGQGHVMAVSTLAGKDALEPSECSDAFGMCLEQIEKSPGTSEDEKTLARIITPLRIEAAAPWQYPEALPSDPPWVDSTQASNALRCVLETIAQAVPGPIAAVIARTTIDASREIHYYPERNAITTRGLNAIGEQPGVKPEEQVYARFAGKINPREYIGYTVTMIDRIHNEALAALSSGAVIPGPAGVTCGTFALKMQTLDPWGEQGDSILHGGLKVFYEDPGSTAGQKFVAKKAFVTPFDATSETIIKKAFLTALVSTSSEPLTNRTARAVIEAEKECETERTRDFVFAWTLETVNESPDASILQKTLAGDGIILRNRTIDMATRLDAQKMILEAITAVPPREANDGDTMRVLKTLKAKLPESCRDIRSLDYLAGMEREAQAVDGVSSGTVECNDDYIYIDGLKLPIFHH